MTDRVDIKAILADPTLRTELLANISDPGPDGTHPVLPAEQLSKILGNLDFPKVSIRLDDDVLSIEPAINSDGATAVQINGYDVAYLEKRIDGAWNLRVVAWQDDKDFAITPDVVIHVPKDPSANDGSPDA